MSARDLSTLSDDALMAALARVDLTQADPATADRPPSGCGWCGIARHGHFRRYTEPVGWHGYVAPSQAQIKSRMLKRHRHTLKLREASR